MDLAKGIKRRTEGIKEDTLLHWVSVKVGRKIRDLSEFMDGTVLTDLVLVVDKEGFIEFKKTKQKFGSKAAQMVKKMRIGSKDSQETKEEHRVKTVVKYLESEMGTGNLRKMYTQSILSGAAGILTLLGNIILHFEIWGNLLFFRYSEMSTHDKFLKWINQYLPLEKWAKDLTDDWRDGTRLGMFVDNFISKSMVPKQWDYENALANITIAQDTAKGKLGFQKIISAVDLSYKATPAICLIAYLSQFLVFDHNNLAAPQDQDDEDMDDVYLHIGSLNVNETDIYYDLDDTEIAKVPSTTDVKAKKGSSNSRKVTDPLPTLPEKLAELQHVQGPPPPFPVYSSRMSLPPRQLTYKHEHVEDLYGDVCGSDFDDDHTDQQILTNSDNYQGLVHDSESTIIKEQQKCCTQRPEKSEVDKDVEKEQEVYENVVEPKIKRGVPPIPKIYAPPVVPLVYEDVEEDQEDVYDMTEVPNKAPDSPSLPSKCEIIRRNFVYLIKEIRAIDIQDQLFQDGLLDMDDIERISVQETEKDRMRKLLKLIMRKIMPAKEWLFLECVKTTYPHVHQALLQRQLQYARSQSTPQMGKVPGQKATLGKSPSAADVNEDYTYVDNPFDYLDIYMARKAELLDHVDTDGVEALRKYKDVPTYLIKALKRSDRLILQDQACRQGTFSHVFEAQLHDDDEGLINVAAKTMKDLSKDVNLMEEAALMLKLKHANIMPLSGLVWKGEKWYLLQPWMARGDLLTYMAAEKELKTARMLTLAADVACGMEYLADLKIVHRDLAARNCLVDKNHRVKVSDFCLTRCVFQQAYQKQGELGFAYQWQAPEVLGDLLYSTKSDMWSYGVVLWELFTLGKTPYDGMISTRVTTFLLRGNRLPKPDRAPDNLYALMKRCWSDEPADRPMFEDVMEDLESLTSDEDPGYVYNMNKPFIFTGKQVVSARKQFITDTANTEVKWLQPTNRYR